jgi:hypothetical protein
MEFNFNVFFGLESQINTMGDRMILALFAIMMYGEVVLLIVSGYLKKFKITLFSSQLNIVILTLGLTIFFGTLVSLLLSYFVYDCSKVKILYCWIAILMSMFYFSIFNYNNVKKFVYNKH